MIRKIFRYPPESARAPKNGDVNATKIAVIEIPSDHKEVPT